MKSARIREWNLAIEMTRYLHTNYNRHIAIKDLADHFHMSSATPLAFLNNIWRTLSETLVRYRINYAKNYLLYSDDSIEEIAAKVGMSTTTLQRRFKIEKISIGEYRQNINK